MCSVFLVVLIELSVLAKWLARKTPLRKPNCGEGIVSRKPRLKSAHDFLGLLYCFIVLLCICAVSCPYVTYYPTVMARYSLFVLKVPLNSKQTNNVLVLVANDDDDDTAKILLLPMMMMMIMMMMLTVVITLDDVMMSTLGWLVVSCLNTWPVVTRWTRPQRPCFYVRCSKDCVTFTRRTSCTLTSRWVGQVWGAD